MGYRAAGKMRIGSCNQALELLTLLADSSRLAAAPTPQLDPGRGMVTGLGLIAHPGIDARSLEVRRQVPVEQQVIDAQTRIARPMVAEVVPEREHLLLRMQVPDSVNPAAGQQALEAIARFGLQQRILLPGLGLPANSALSFRLRNGWKLLHFPIQPDGKPVSVR